MLVESIVRICGVEADQVDTTSTLDDLGIDSLAVAELITDLEIRSGVDLPLDVLRRLNLARTVGDVEVLLQSAMADASPSRG